MQKHDQLRYAVRELWARDYDGDVRALNSGLAKRGRASAGFEAAPPSVLTGTPFVLHPRECIGIIGLNPKWQPRMENCAEIQTAIREHRDGHYEKYEQRRSRYFEDGSPEFYGRYFSKLQNRLSETILAQQVSAPSSVFREKAFKIDLLPWWSSNTSLIDQNQASLLLEPLRVWKSVIETFISVLQPTALVMNGCGMRDLACLLLQTKLTPFKFGPGKAEVAYSGRAFGVPLLAHRQLNAQGAPSSPEAYRRLTATWKHLQ